MSGSWETVSRRRLLGGLGAAGTSALAGCSASPVTPSGGDLRIGTLHPPITLDPITLHDVGSARMAEKIFDGLYTYDRATDLVPQIAVGDPQVADDGQRYTVRLREDATFQNGQPISPEDVKYSFEASVREETPNAWRFDMIQSVEIPDDRTVQFELEYPYPAFTHSLTQAIVPKSVREAGVEQFATEPVGSGPFELRQFAEEKKTKVVRWRDYWGEPKPALGKVTAVYQESPITRMMSLVSGRNRVIEPVSPRIRERLAARSDANVVTREGFNSYFVGFNLNEGPTTDPKVRKAVDYCIDMDAAMADFVEPIGERQHSPLPDPMAKEWDMPLEEWREIPLGKNTAEAKLLFEEAGMQTEIEILVPKDPKRRELGRRLASGIREAGRRASVSPATWKSYLEKYRSGAPSDYMVYVGGVNGGPDPDSFLYQLFHRDQEGETQGVFYDNTTVMEQLERARKTTDRDRRRKLYESAITTILRERVHLPAYSYKNSFGYKNTVRNFRVHPDAQLNPRVVSPDGVVSIDDTDLFDDVLGDGESR